eukprot:82727-Prorocentrum_minimum.AAC.3
MTPDCNAHGPSVPRKEQRVCVGDSTHKETSSQRSSIHSFCTHPQHTESQIISHHVSCGVWLAISEQMLASECPASISSLENNSKALPVGTIAPNGQSANYAIIELSVLDRPVSTALP